MNKKNMPGCFLKVKNHNEKHNEKFKQKTINKFIDNEDKR